MKALRQTTKRTLVVARERARVDGLLRRARAAVAKPTQETLAIVRAATTALDKAVAHGALKKNTVGRLKSRLMRRLPKA